MKLFRRYFLREYFRYFIILTGGFTAIAVLAEFFDKSSEFYNAESSFSLIAQYLLLQTPRVILYALPFASLFSILITIGIASKWQEIIVVKASGTSTKKLFGGFLILGMMMSVVSLILGEMVVPAATRKAVELRKVKILKQPPRIIESKESLWLKGTDGSLIRIKGFVEDRDSVLRTSIFYFSDDFVLKKRIEADEAEWADGVWNLKNTTIFDFSANVTGKFDSYASTSIEKPDIFKEDMKKPMEMSFIELYSYYSRLERAGFRNLKYTVRLYEKLAYPTINFVMILFGIALALNANWGGGIRAAGLGVIVSVLYWLLYAMSISMGNAGLLKPWIAPWVSPFLFCLLGGLMYVRIKE